MVINLTNCLEQIIGQIANYFREEDLGPNLTLTIYLNIIQKQPTGNPYDFKF